jgi:RNA-directed DNA polymerase
MSTVLQGIAKTAREPPQPRCGNLDERLNEAYLRECWGDLRKDAAYGVDHVSAEAYEQHLEENIHDLVERLIRMLQERLEDGALLRLMRKWLKAGVLETDGQVIHPATGTPQGGVISPILANVYLH